MIRQELNPETCKSDPEWFPRPRSSSKIHRRRGFDEIIQIHRRHGRRNNPNNRKYYRRHDLGENTEEGSDAENTDCGNRVDSKQRSVTA